MVRQLCALVELLLALDGLLKDEAVHPAERRGVDSVLNFGGHSKQVDIRFVAI